MSKNRKIKNKTSESGKAMFEGLNQLKELTINQSIKEDDIEGYKDVNIAKASDDFDKRYSIIQNIDISKLVSAPDEWNFYQPLSDDKMYELLESISTKGLLNPTIVWEQENGTYMILSGHNRTKAFKKLLEITNDEDKYKNIGAIIKRKDEITELQAREIIIDSNWVQRELSPYERAKSILIKYKELEKSRPQIAEEYKISARQIASYYKLNDLNEELGKLIDGNTVSIESGCKLAMFDSDRQRYIYENFKDKLKNSTIKNLKTKMKEDEIKVILLNKRNDEKIKKTITIPKYLEKSFNDMIYEWKITNNLIKKETEAS